MTPLTGAGYGAARWQETLVAFGFASVGLTIVATAILLLIGFRHR
jgi:(hydroxyamino)benzene mutase